MNKNAFVAKLKKFRGRYKVIAEETGVGYVVIRKYASGHIPEHKMDAVLAIEKWMKGRRP
jgi:hypothetical protein